MSTFCSRFQLGSRGTSQAAHDPLSTALGWLLQTIILASRDSLCGLHHAQQVFDLRRHTASLAGDPCQELLSIGIKPIARGRHTPVAGVRAVRSCASRPAQSSAGVSSHSPHFHTKACQRGVVFDRFQPQGCLAAPSTVLNRRACTAAQPCRRSQQPPHMQHQLPLATSAAACNICSRLQHLQPLATSAAARNSQPHSQQPQERLGGAIATERTATPLPHSTPLL
eukprot:365023-Chlamydomonas_euryale.AAC.3